MDKGGKVEASSAWILAPDTSGSSRGGGADRTSGAIRGQDLLPGSSDAAPCRTTTPIRGPADVRGPGAVVVRGLGEAEPMAKRRRRLLHLLGRGVVAGASGSRAEVVAESADRSLQSNDDYNIHQTGMEFVAGHAGAPGEEVEALATRGAPSAADAAAAWAWHARGRGGEADGDGQLSRG